MREIELKDIKNIHYYGRIGTKKYPYPMFGTASGIELQVKAKELWIEFESDYEKYEPWVSILIDEAKVSRQMILKGKHWIPAIINLDDNISRTIRIVKDTQAMNGDEKCFLRISKIKIDGELYPVEEKKMKIEFIGDSITSGEGASGAKNEMEWVPMVFSGVDNYATMIAKDLRADYRIISQSGWGVLSSWDGNPKCNLPSYYKMVCGYANGAENERDGAYDNYDFNSWIADYIIINLGTNDYSAFSQPSVYYDENGILFDQKKDENGELEEKSLDRLKKSIYSFIKEVRSFNSKAKIIWAYGMLGSELSEVIQTTVRKFKTEEKDKNIFYIELQQASPEMLGSREHPGFLCHQQAEEKLVSYIQSLEEKNLTKY